MKKTIATHNPTSPDPRRSAFPIQVIDDIRRFDQFNDIEALYNTLTSAVAQGQRFDFSSAAFDEERALLIRFNHHVNTVFEQQVLRQLDTETTAFLETLLPLAVYACSNATHQNAIVAPLLCYTPGELCTSEDPLQPPSIRTWLFENTQLGTMLGRFATGSGRSQSMPRRSSVGLTSPNDKTRFSM